MSEENVEIFKRAVETWNRDDFDAWIDLFDLSSSGTRPSSVPLKAPTGVFRGLVGAREVWESYKGEAFQQLEARYDEFRDLGESVLAIGEIEIIGQASQLEVTSEIAQLLTFRGGKIASSRDFMSHAEALEAAGLSE